MKLRYLSLLVAGITLLGTLAQAQIVIDENQDPFGEEFEGLFHLFCLIDSSDDFDADYNNIFKKDLEGIPELAPEFKELEKDEAFIVYNTIKELIAESGGIHGIGLDCPPGTAVPEPSTYGMIGASALLGLIVFRRFRRKHLSN